MNHIVPLFGTMILGPARRSFHRGIDSAGGGSSAEHLKHVLSVVPSTRRTGKIRRRSCVCTVGMRIMLIIMPRATFFRPGHWPLSLPSER